MPPSIFDLPNEILMYIFQLSFEGENKIKCLEDIAKIHPKWKNIYLDSSLWKKFDGTIKFKTMMNMCEAGSFRMTKEFIISSVDSLSDENIDKLFPKLKNVKILDFSKLTNLSENILTAVEVNCTNLCEIRFGHIDIDKEEKHLKYSLLGTFLNAIGSHLLSISLSHCKLSNASLIIRCIADCCPNLEKLYIVNIFCTGINFSTHYFQKKCPKLKVLQLDHSSRINVSKYSEGFPQLEVFSYFDAGSNTMYDKELNVILFNSANLRSLDLSNCSISAEILIRLPAGALQCLNISRTKACSSEKLTLVLGKWCNSLTEVDVSYAATPAINDSIAHLVITPHLSPLKSLNLSYSKIEPNIVLKVLEKSSHLQVLGLESCRSLGRGMKKNYFGKLALQELEKNIKSSFSKEEILID